MNDDQTMDQENQEPSRRRFLKAAAGAGVVGAVWAEPLIRGIPAYATDASSLVGMVGGLEITWSTMRSNWETDTMGMITRTSVSGPMFDDDNECGFNATWMTTGGAVMGDDVTITAVGGPGHGDMCGSPPSTSTISLEPQTGCIFTNVTVTAGMVDMTSGNPIIWSGAGNPGMIYFMFNIDC